MVKSIKDWYNMRRSNDHENVDGRLFS